MSKIFCSTCMHYGGIFLTHYCKKTAHKISIPPADTYEYRARQFGSQIVYGTAPNIKNMHNNCSDYESNFSTYLKEKILSWVR